MRRLFSFLLGLTVVLALVSSSAQAQKPSARKRKAAQAAAAPAASTAPASEKIFPYPLKVDRLDNGLTVVRVPFNSPGLVAYYTVVRVGSRNEVEPGHSGFAHFFEHMMFRGTKKNPEGVRDRALAAAGWNENAFTTDDFTVYHLVGPTTGLGQLIEFEADRFQNLEYSEPAFQTEAKAVLGEYHKSAARPELRMEEALLAKAFTAHTYKHTTLGFYADIQKMPGYYEYSKQFFERWYTPDNSMIYVVGDFDDAKVMEQIRSAYGTWTRKSANVKIPVEGPQRQQNILEVPWSGPTLPRLVYAWRTPAARLDTMDAAIQRVLEAYLIGPTSDLHKQLVLDQQLAESLGSWYYEHRDPFLFTITATLKSEKNRKAVQKAFDRQIKGIVTGRIDPRRIEAIKAHVRYSVLMDLETPNDVANSLAWYGAIFGEPNALEAHLQNIAKVTPENLREFVKRHFPAKNRTILHLVAEPPKKASAGVKK